MQDPRSRTARGPIGAGREGRQARPRRTRVSALHPQASLERGPTVGIYVGCCRQHPRTAQPAALRSHPPTPLGSAPGTSKVPGRRCPAPCPLHAWQLCLGLGMFTPHPPLVTLPGAVMSCFSVFTWHLCLWWAGHEFAEPSPNPSWVTVNPAPPRSSAAPQSTEWGPRRRWGRPRLPPTLAGMGSG